MELVVIPQDGGATGTPPQDQLKVGTQRICSWLRIYLESIQDGP